jgi:hypothetical protein
MAPIVASLPFDDIVIWDNSKRPVDERAYGRYAAIAEAKHEIIYVQDDDNIIHPETLHLLYNTLQHTGSTAVNIDPHRENPPWVGWGAMFWRHCPDRPHRRYLERWPRDELFLQFCDIFFTGQVATSRVWGPFTELTYARDRSRTCEQPGYYTERRPEAMRRARELAAAH